MTTFLSYAVAGHDNQQKLSTLAEMILNIRNQAVMIDRDLAALYGVETKVLNQAVKRNKTRFPDQFCWQLTPDEFIELVTNCDRFRMLKHSSSMPHVFTEQGVAMLSAVLKSETAIRVSIDIMNAFVQLRRALSGIPGIQFRIEKIENRQTETENQLSRIFEILESRDMPVNTGVFFDGQVYDAYAFITDLIGLANHSIWVIDNYIDVNTIRCFVSKKENVEVTIFTKSLNERILWEVAQFNKQYPLMNLREFPISHDRFIIIDGKSMYHIGASLKDLGKRWFAFSRMDAFLDQVLKRIQDYD